ncbi:MAG: hypothetical protein AAB595_02940 [Patescibacteria group bacterium]
MRNPNPEYIVNLITQLIGADILKSLADHWLDYPSLWAIQQVVGRTIESKLDSMRTETLAGIIEYSDVLVPVGKPLIRRCERLQNYFDQTTKWPPGMKSSGRALLHELAFVTLLMIIMDMIKQEEYKVDNELIAEEREWEEFWARFNLPRNHSLYGMPPEVKF